jgi:hypothetical protein
MDRKPLIAVSRVAAQTAEDARAIAIKKIDEMRLANERQDSADARHNRNSKPMTRTGRKGGRKPTQR